MYRRAWQALLLQTRYQQINFVGEQPLLQSVVGAQNLYIDMLTLQAKQAAGNRAFTQELIAFYRTERLELAELLDTCQDEQQELQDQIKSLEEAAKTHNVSFHCQ